MKCSKCKNIRDVKYFYKDISKKNGIPYCSLCKDCKKIKALDKKGDIITIDTDHIIKLLKYFEYSCPYCGKDITYNYTIDHIKPRGRVNSTAMSTKDNIVLCCINCNAEKATKPIDEFYIIKLKSAL